MKKYKLYNLCRRGIGEQKCDKTWWVKQSGNEYIVCEQVSEKEVIKWKKGKGLYLFSASKYAMTSSYANTDENKEVKRD